MSLSIELSPEQESALRSAADAQGLSAEQLVRRLVDEELSNTKRESGGSTGQAPLSAKIRQLWADMPADVRAELPEGGARQIDRQVYGLPKR